MEQRRRTCLMRVPKSAIGIWTSGWVLAIGGIVELIEEELFRGESFTREAEVEMLLGSTAVIVGTILLIGALLSERTAAENAAYRLGYDVGEVTGYRAGRADSTTLVLEHSEDGKDEGASR